MPTNTQSVIEKAFPWGKVAERQRGRMRVNLVPLMETV